MGRNGRRASWEQEETHMLYLNRDWCGAIVAPASMARSVGRLAKQNVMLTDISGRSWPVQFEWYEGTFHLTKGWFPFYEAHDLSFNHTVLFRRVGRAEFAVQLFDGRGRLMRVFGVPPNREIRQG